MSEPCALVEHFFRHEFDRLVAVLTRSLGVRRLFLCCHEAVPAESRVAIALRTLCGFSTDI